MRALIQRVRSASVLIDNSIERRIGTGLTIFLGILKGDSPDLIPVMCDKIINLRIFSNLNGKFDHSLKDIGGEVLVVSQFTLYANYSKGRRPDFIRSAPPEEARVLYSSFVDYFSSDGIHVQTGEFGADMLVRLENDGPVTIMIDSEEL